MEEKKRSYVWYERKKKKLCLENTIGDRKRHKINEFRFPADFTRAKKTLVAYKNVHPGLSFFKKISTTSFLSFHSFAQDGRNGKKIYLSTQRKINLASSASLFILAT